MKDIQMNRERTKMNEEFSENTYYTSDNNSLTIFCRMTSNTCCTCKRRTVRKHVLPNMGVNTLYTLSVIVTIVLFSLVKVVEGSPRAYKSATNWYARREDQMVVSSILSSDHKLLTFTVNCNIYTLYILQYIIRTSKSNSGLMIG